MTRRGVTLAELMVALACTALLAAAMLNAYARAVKVAPALQASELKIATDQEFRDKLTDLIHHAYVLNVGGAPTAAVTVTVGAGGATTTSTATGPRTYFTTNPQSNNSGLASSGGSQSTTSGSNSSPLVFTVLGEPTSHAALEDSSADFTQQNQSRGPVGGMVEYQVGLSPVGTPPSDKKGAFIRMQRPADTDPTTGGYEWLLLPGVDNLMFEFWDGTQWQESWDTLTMNPIRLPAAVRVTYSSGSETPHVFVVRVPLSDVTPANPATSIGGGAAG